MKFTEEQATELMQYAIETRNRKYEFLKRRISNDLRIFKKCEFRLLGFDIGDFVAGEVIGIYELMLHSGIIEISDFSDLYDEIIEKFDCKNICAEIENQKSLNAKEEEKENGK